MRRDAATYIKQITIAVLVVGIIAAGGIVAAKMLTPRSTLQIGTGIFNTEVVSEDSDRQRGLSGRKTLAKTDAMLFVFDHDSKWGIWMKDMQFPIDIIWLDQDKKVVHVKQNADPNNYPESYVPTKKARYVAEFSAGTIKDKQIYVGSTAKFDIEGKN